MGQAESGLQEWLDKGYHGEMDYMAKHGTRRIRPATIAVAALGASIFAPLGITSA